MEKLCRDEFVLQPATFHVIRKLVSILSTVQIKSICSRNKLEVEAEKPSKTH